MNYTLNVKEWKIARNFEWLWFNSNRVWFRSLRVKICFHDSLLCQSEGRSQRSDTKTPLFHGVNYWPIRNGYLPAVAACISHACAIACIARLTYAALRALCMHVAQIYISTWPVDSRSCKPLRSGWRSDNFLSKSSEYLQVRTFYMICRLLRPELCLN